MIRACCLLVSAMLTASTLAQSPVAASAAAKKLTTQQILRTRLPAIDLRDAPLEDACGLIGQLAGVQVYVRWDRLASVGVAQDAPVTIQAKDVSLEQVLWMMLNLPQVSEARLAYRAEGAWIVVSTAEDFEGEMIVRVYDITDLLVERLRRPEVAFGRTRQVPISNTVATAGGAVAVQPVIDEVESGVFYQGEDAGGGDVDRARLIRELIHIITTTIEPDSWAGAGGRGTIAAFQNKLVVRNSPLVHQRIAGPIEQSTAP